MEDEIDIYAGFILITTFVICCKRAYSKGYVSLVEFILTININMYLGTKIMYFLSNINISGLYFIVPLYYLISAFSHIFYEKNTLNWYFPTIVMCIIRY